MGLKPHVKTEVTLLELHDPKLPKSVGHSMNGFGFQGEKVKNKIVINLLFKVIHPKYYKHLKKCTHQRHGLDSGNLACTSSKTEILNKIGI